MTNGLGAGVRLYATGFTIPALAAMFAVFTTTPPSLAGPASTAPALVPEEYVEVAVNGLGDAQNSIAWSAAWWNGKLYVGTGRSVACVQSAALEVAAGLPAPAGPGGQSDDGGQGRAGQAPILRAPPFRNR